MLHGLTGRPTYGVLPFRHGLGIDEEDGLRVSPARRRSGSRRSAPPSARTCCGSPSCAVPLMSNFTDVDALAAEPGVVVRFVDRAEELADADLVVCRARAGTVRALEWLRERGLADALRAAGRRGAAGARHLRRLPDARRAHRGRGRVAGGHGRRARAAARTGAVRARRRPSPGRSATALGERVEGYEIHHGVAEVLAGTRVQRYRRCGLDGCRVGAGLGHALARLAGERRLPAGLPARGGRGRGPARSCRRRTRRFGALREEQLDRLGDLIEEHADTDALLRLIESGRRRDCRSSPRGRHAG